MLLAMYEQAIVQLKAVIAEDAAAGQAVAS